MGQVKITFIRDYQPKAVDSELYEKGQSISCDQRSADHFISRGAAVTGRAARDAAKAAEEAERREREEAERRETEGREAREAEEAERKAAEEAARQT